MMRPKKKKAATGLCVQCKLCFKLGNERPAWPSQELACHPGYVFFQVVVDHVLPLHRWEQKTGTCWELGLLVLSLVCVSSCHASDSCLEGCICPPFMGICWTGGRQVPCPAFSCDIFGKWFAWALCLNTSCGILSGNSPKPSYVVMWCATVFRMGSTSVAEQNGCKQVSGHIQWW